MRDTVDPLDRTLDSLDPVEREEGWDDEAEADDPCVDDGMGDY